MACVLQRLCTPRGPPAARRSSPSAAAQAQQPPSHLEEQNHLPQKMHTQSCLASFFCNIRTCSNDDHTAPSPRSSPARAQRHRPTWGQWLRHKERRSETTTCPVSLLPLLRPAAMIAKLHRLSAAWWCRGRRRRTRPGQCLPGGAATHPPQDSLRGQWRRRRNSLVAVTVHQNTTPTQTQRCRSAT